MAGRLQGRRVLIAGATGGLGRAVAELFHAEGAALALLARDGERLTEIAQALSASPVEADLGDSRSVDAALARAVAALGGLDGVVYAAGSYLRRPLAETSDADWTELVAANLTGPFHLCRAAAPALRAAAGAARTIVTISSGAAVVPPGPNLAAYAAVKGGVVAFTKALARELAPDVRANAVLAGNTRTPLTARNMASMTPEERTRFSGAYALRRVAEPSEIAQAALFLTSAESAYVTGAALAVDGGRTFH